MAEDKFTTELQTVYSDKKQQADYYMWHDENPLAENRDGLFVSMRQDYEHNDIHGSLCCISICDGSQDVFGVTVSEAGFIGGQEYIQAVDGIPAGRGREYGLVVHSGMAGVRRETSVIVGDYVVPNIRGEAKKSDGDYGYLVTALSEVNGIKYAVISLVAPSTLEKKWSDGVQDLSNRMITAEHNITSAINVANSAYALAQDTKESTDANIGFIGSQVNDALDRVEVIEDTVGTLNESVISASTSAVLAKTIAESAVSSAELIRSEAVEKANEANANVNNLIKDLEPITKWKDPDTGNAGAEYLTTYINNGLATKVEVQTVETKTDEALSAVEQNAKSIQSLVSTIDKYAIGEYSQAYGLTQEQAKAILPIGAIYVPTVKHDGEHIYNSSEFLLGYYYEWNGEKWAPSQSVAVNFSSQFIYGSEATPYWVVTESDVVQDGTTYDLGGLYKWEDGDWVKVASVSDNVLSRSISNIKQTANSITASVNDVKGDVSALDIRVGNAESSLTTVTTWKSDVEKDVEKIATIEQKTNDNASSIALVVTEKDGEEAINTASIVTAINDSESSVAIEADKIAMTGTTTFLKPDDVGEGGSTVIDGGRITTGQIDTDRLDVSEIITVGTDNITTITEDTISTTNVLAKNLQVEGANVKNLNANSIIVAGDKTVQDFIDNSIDSMTIYYALSTSVKTPPADNEWSEEEPKKEGKQYMWQKTITVYGDGSIEEEIFCVDGKGHITVDIKCSTGTIYINNNITNVTLTARVFQENQDITDEFKDGDFLWEKYDMDGNLDRVWSYTGKTIPISHTDIYKRAVFNCILKVENRL